MRWGMKWFQDYERPGNGTKRDSTSDSDDDRQGGKGVRGSLLRLLSSKGEDFWERRCVCVCYTEKGQMLEDHYSDSGSDSGATLRKERAQSKEWIRSDSEPFPLVAKSIRFSMNTTYTQRERVCVRERERESSPHSLIRPHPEVTFVDNYIKLLFTFRILVVFFNNACVRDML